MFQHDYPAEARILALLTAKTSRIVSDDELYAVFDWFYGDEYGRRDFNAALTWLNQNSLVSCNYHPEKKPQVTVEILQAGKLLTDASLLKSLLVRY